MEQILTKAKINLTLDVVAKREDGYHDLKMIMHSVNLYDKIKIHNSNSGKIILKTNSPYVPCDERNIIMKAIRKFEEETLIKVDGMDIYVEKHIPVCAGLAGGSTNAAGMLKYLNEKYDNPLSWERLIEVGKELGADVPYCMTGGTCLAEGIGEKLTPVDSMPECYIVIARPNNRGISTARVFKMIDINEISYHPDTDGMLEALKQKNIYDVSKRLFNVLESYAITLDDEIEVFKDRFLKNGAMGAIMSGSGNSCFGIFDDADKAEKCRRDMKKLTNQVYVV